MGGLSVSRIREWIRSGPEDDANTVEFMLGMWLWWRIWVMVGLISVSFFTTGLLVTWYDADEVVFLVLGLGIVIGTFLIKVNPKYTVTKNF